MTMQARRRDGKGVAAWLAFAVASASAGVLAGCGSTSGGGGSPDTGTTPPVDASFHLDTGIDATQAHDVISIFGGDTGLPDVGVDSPTEPDGVAPGDSGDKDGGIDAGVHDTGAPNDTGTKDTGTKDSGGKDTGGTCTPVTVPSGTGGFPACAAPVSNMCGPGSTAGFTATAPAPATPTNKCTSQQVQAVYDGCLGPSSSNNACMLVDTNCYDCVFNGTIANPGLPWGPLVAADDMIVNLNIGGCLQLLEPCNVTCANALNEDLECEQKACGTNCPITDDAGSDTAYGNCVSAIDNCYTSASGQGCGSYSVGTSCASSITGSAHPGSVCFANPDNFEAGFLAIVPLFCSAP